MKKLGLVPRVAPHAAASTGYLAGSDSDRASDFNAMARDPQVRAIVALRGGYGTMRILDHLDYNALASDPKVVMGFSDMTAVINAIALRSGIVTFHGPVAARESNYGEGTLNYIRRAWMSTSPIGTLSTNAAYTLRSGSASGRIAGGNLSLVSALCGTSYAIPAADALLLLEETEESPYRVDRMLTQLHLAGALSSSAAILFGQCTKCEATGASMSIDQVLHDRISTAGRPAMGGIPVGHIDEQWVLPIGIKATLDASSRTLSIHEPAVAPR